MEKKRSINVTQESNGSYTIVSNLSSSAEEIEFLSDIIESIKENNVIRGNSFFEP